MAIVKLNGRHVIGGTIMMPRAGVWHADLEVDGDATLAAAVTLDDDGIKFSGTVYRQGAVGGNTFVRIRGGKGGMSKVLDARSYVDAPLSVPLGDILTGAGETLAQSSDAAVLARRLPHWTRVGGPDGGEAGAALQMLVEKAGAVWRVLRDGTVWVGVETYPTQKIASFQRLDPDPVLATYVIAPDKLELLPGVTFDGRKVSRVEHQIHGTKIRSVYWAEDSASGTLGSSALDRIKEPLAKFIRWVMRDTLYHALWPATVQSQDGSGLVSLYPDDAAIRGTGTDRVPIRYGLTGASQKVAAGARALLGFENGQPSSPYCILTGQGAATQTTLPTGTLPAARQGDMVAISLMLVPAVTPTGAPIPGVYCIAVPPGTKPPPFIDTLGIVPGGGPAMFYGLITSGNPLLKA